MRAPRFWYRPALDPESAGQARRAWLPGLLGPAAAAVSAAGALRHRLARPYHAQIPVVCVGNLVAGGAGKTPVALALVEALVSEGWTPHFLTRGYGGRLAGPALVQPAFHTVSHVGDEALLLARKAPTWVGRDRAVTARAAEAAGADILVMDDGFQNPGLHKDLSLMVVDAAVGFGNGRVLPAGPLREPLSRGLARAQAVVLVGDGKVDIPGMLRQLRGRLLALDEALGGRRVFAFSGIGRPEKFFASLRGVGADIVGTRSFADHHLFTRRELDAIADDCRRLAAVPVTTAKDAVRFDPEQLEGLRIFAVRFALDEAAGFGPLLSLLPQRRPAK